MRGLLPKGLITPGGIYQTIDGPTTMKTRLLLEDIPTGSVFYASVARTAGVPTPITDAVIDACNAVYRTDFRQTGRTLARYGLDHLDAESLVKWGHS